MERNNKLYLPWLKPLIDTNFYGHNNICLVHNQYCTIFCKKCSDKPHCESCWRVDPEAEHEGHQYLQIFKVSTKASVRKAEIEREVDVTKIQPYIINTHKVALLKSKDGHGGYPSCVICQVKIKDEQYQFCSISCKIVGDAEGLTLGHSESDSVEETEAECSSQSNINSLRKRPRKRRPWRSPLF